MELYLPPKRPERNAKGQFVKGIIPHNKGRKAIEYMDEETIKRVKQIGLKNLRPNKNFGGQNKKTVIAFNDENRVVGCFSSAEEAARKVGVTSSCIRNVCYGKRKHSAGLVWKYEEDL